LPEALAREGGDADPVGKSRGSCLTA
jgi:hypothetical protein